MERMKLGEIVEDTISGEWGTEEKKDENDIFVIRTADFCNDGRINYSNIIKRNIAKRKIEEKSLKIGDIIVEKSGGTDKNPVGRVVLFDKENCKCLANNFTQVLRIKKEHYYKFIFYQLFYKYKSGGTLQMFNKTTGIQNLQMKLYLNQKLNVCDKKEQIKISNLLDKVQEIVDIRKKEIEKLDELIKSQFVEMFENEKYTKIKLGEEFKISSGGTPSKNKEEYWNSNDISWIGSNMCQNKIIYENDGKYISNSGLEHSSAKIYPIDTILVALVGATIGKTALLKFETATNQNIAGIQVSKRFNAEYVYFAIQNLYYKFTELSKGTFKMANLSFVRNLEIPMPPIELQNQFAEIVKQIDKQKFEIQKSLEEMEKLQESLMNKYFG